MCKLNVLIYFKGKIYHRTFENDKIMRDYKIRVLLGSKQSKNDYGLARYHYICRLYNGSTLIPDTTIIPDKTSYIKIKLTSNEFNEYSRKEWDLPLHAIGCHDDVFPFGR